MVTKNIRAVTYLPPDYHKKLRQYMKTQNLTESAALVQIVRQFFEGKQEPQPTPGLKAFVEGVVTEQLAPTRTEIELLKTQLNLLQHRLEASEPAPTPRKHRLTATAPLNAPPLSSLTEGELTIRLGVSPGSVAKEAAKGQPHFRTWSKRKDPSGTAWEKRGSLYHPT